MAVFNYIDIFLSMEITTNKPLFEAVGCVCILQKKLLLLRRNQEKSYPDHWGLPSGKREENETSIQAALRELFEETGILRTAHNLKFIDTLNIRTADFTFLYTLYVCELTEGTIIKMNASEHSAFGWYSSDEALQLKLVPGLEECLRIVFPELQLSYVQLDLFSDIRTKIPPPPKNDPAIDPSIFNNYNMHNKNYWVSFGPPASGKSTALNEMSKVNPSLKVVRDPTILTKPKSNLSFYLKKAWEDGERSYFFHFQIEVLLFRFIYTLQAPSSSLIDESIYSTLAYSHALRSLSWIGSSEYDTFMKYYRVYVSLLPKPSALFYFRCEPAVLLARMERRGRKIEKLYPSEYIQALSDSFNIVANQLKEEDNFPVIIIDTNRRSATEIARKYVPK